uniref:Putative secreted protein n=1 Tax=Panstrongylus lignarius TaxID=156445 RepID=A0A224Y4T7_9HEMI
MFGFYKNLFFWLYVSALVQAFFSDRIQVIILIHNVNFTSYTISMWLPEIWGPQNSLLRISNPSFRERSHKKEVKRGYSGEL